MNNMNQNEFEGFELEFQRHCTTEDTDREDSCARLPFGCSATDKMPAHQRALSSSTPRKSVRRFHSSNDLSFAHEEVSSSSSRILDLKGLAARCMDDRDVMKEVMESFQQQCKDRIESLEQAMQRADLAQVVFDVDFISGAAKNVGAIHLDTSLEELMASLRPSVSGASRTPYYQNGSRRSSDGNLDVSVAWLRSEEAQVCFKRVQNEFWLAQKFWQSLPDASAQADAASRQSSFVQRNTRLNGYLRKLGRSESCDSSTTDAVDETPADLVLDATHMEDQDWARPASVGRLFEFAQHRIALVRQSFARGRRDTIALLVEDVCTYSTQAEMKSLSKKSAELLQKPADQLRIADIQQLEQQIDASKAIWESCGLRV